jgi:hypothetical protein
MPFSFRTLSLITLLALAQALSAASSFAEEVPAETKTGTVSGKIVDANGNPVKGATVAAFVGGGLPLPKNKWGPISNTVSGDKGDFKLIDVPVGQIRIGAQLKDVGVSRGTTDFDVVAGKETKVGEIKIKDDRPAASRPASMPASRTSSRPV